MEITFDLLYGIGYTDNLGWVLKKRGIALDYCFGNHDLDYSIPK